MKAGSMEGLIGASVNMKLTRTPLRVYKEAERRGDTATMERAMGYVAEFREKAHEYSDKAQEELAKELKEERKEQELKREQAVEKRKEETKEYIEKVQENSTAETTNEDSLEISEEGKILLKDNEQTRESASIAENTDVKIYTSEGKTVLAETKAVSIDTKIGNGIGQKRI